MLADSKSKKQITESLQVRDEEQRRTENLFVSSCKHLLWTPIKSPWDETGVLAETESQQIPVISHQTVGRKAV